MPEGQALDGSPQEPLEGEAPPGGGPATLAELIDLAFDYRGDVTVVTHDGSTLTGYLFNRDPDAPEPFVEMFDSAGAGPYQIRYTEIRTVRFTGKDAAAGTSYAAWLRRRRHATGPGATSPDDR